MKCAETGGRAAPGAGGRAGRNLWFDSGECPAQYNECHGLPDGTSVGVTGFLGEIYRYTGCPGGTNGDCIYGNFQFLRSVLVKPIPANVAQIGPDSNWFHSNQARCLWNGVKAAAGDEAHVDDAKKLTGPHPKLSGGAALWGIEKVAEYVSKHPAAVGAAVARSAGLLGKIAGAFGYALSGYTGVHTYNACMAN